MKVEGFTEDGYESCGKIILTILIIVVCMSTGQNNSIVKLHLYCTNWIIHENSIQILLLVTCHSQYFVYLAIK